MRTRPSPSYPEGIGVVETDGKRLQCELCGGWYRNLGIHSSHGHGLPANEYRELFGLAGGLVSEESRSRYAANGKADILRHYLDIPRRHVGHPMAPQSKLRISESQKLRLRIKPHPRGIPRSAEDRAAISAGVKAWHERRLATKMATKRSSDAR